MLQVPLRSVGAEVAANRRRGCRLAHKNVFERMKAWRQGPLKVGTVRFFPLICANPREFGLHSRRHLHGLPSKPRQVQVLARSSGLVFDFSKALPGEITGRQTWNVRVTNKNQKL